jgi:hypothetical protein
MRDNNATAPPTSLMVLDLEENRTSPPTAGNRRPESPSSRAAGEAVSLPGNDHLIPRIPADTVPAQNDCPAPPSALSNSSLASAQILAPRQPQHQQQEEQHHALPASVDAVAAAAGEHEGKRRLTKL